MKLLITILGPIVNEEKEKEKSKTEFIPLSYLQDKSETVLINSNFNCGYYINRDNLYEILKYKYKISSNYDPCSYPGIQCSFYYDSTLKIQLGMMPVGYNCNKKMKNKMKVSLQKSTMQKSIVQKSEGECEGEPVQLPLPLSLNPNITGVSFMIFRTGSMLIVGKCTEPILYEIYDFLCKLFEIEYHSIVSKISEVSSANSKKTIDEKKIRKIRKKTIYVGVAS